MTDHHSELRSPAASTSADEALELDHEEIRIRRQALLQHARRLGHPRLLGVGIAGGDTLWGYAVTAAGPDKLAALEAALHQAEPLILEYRGHLAKLNRHYNAQLTRIGAPVVDKHDGSDPAYPIPFPIDAQPGISPMPLAPEAQP